MDNPMLDASMMSAVRRGLYYAGRKARADIIHTKWCRLSQKAKRDLYAIYSRVPVSADTRFRQGEAQ